MSQSSKPSRVLIPLGFAVCTSLFGDLSLYAVLVTQMDVVGLTVATVGVMLGVNRLVRIPANPLAGILADQWGRRRLFLTGMVLGVISTSAYGLVHGFWPFLLSRMMWGIGWTLINVNGVAMALDISTNTNRGKLTGIYNAWMMIGFTGGPLLGGFLVDTIGFRTAMLVLAACTLAGFIAVLFFLPETSPPRPEKTPRLTSALLGERLRSVWARRAALLTQHRGLVATSLLYLIMLFAGEGLVFSTVTLLLQRRMGDEVAVGALLIGVPTAAGILLGGRSLLSSLVGPVAGHLSDQKWGRLSVILLSLLLGAVSFVLLAFGNSLAVIVLGIVFSAVSVGTGLAILTAYLGDQTPPGRQGVVMGLYATVGDVGSMAGPFLAFALAEVIELKWIYLTSVLIFVGGAGLVWLNRKYESAKQRVSE